MANPQHIQLLCLAHGRSSKKQGEQQQTGHGQSSRAMNQAREGVWGGTQGEGAAYLVVGAQAKKGIPSEASKPQPPQQALKSH